MEGEVIIVAVDGSKEITDYAVEWAVRNVIKAMDSLILLALLPSRGRPPTSVCRTKYSLCCLLKKWGIVHNEENPSRLMISKAVEHDVSQRIYNVCVQMMQQLCLANHTMKVHTEVKVVGDAQLGSVARRAAELGATWVILDRRLKKESECCLKQLNCNVVLIDHAIPKILRAVNPISRRKHGRSEDQNGLTVADMLGMLPSYTPDHNNSATTQSSLGIESPNSDTDASIFLISSSAEKEQFSVKFSSSLKLDSAYFDQRVEAKSEFRLSPSYSKSQPLNKFSSTDATYSPRKSSANSLEVKGKGHGGALSTKSDIKNVNSIVATQTTTVPARRSTGSPYLFQKPDSLNKSNQMITRKQSLARWKGEPLESLSSPTIDRTSSIRKSISIQMKPPPMPPPLCSVCKHNVPAFGKAPRRFSYKEIERATNKFSSENLLADGGYGPVYKGVLLDGQVIAVKQNKMLSAQGASEFCSEVEALSCAQHRNLVMLVGYCIEKEWLLIYEFACNGSLDKHLHGTEEKGVMAWSSRMKVAVGAARGLRYLHEDCRVGCIIHRDFRPNNILLTHDFESMVGDFGLARWQADGQSPEETRVIGTVGYLAPEYTKTGLITEKVDVYAFGVVLLELLCGTKGTDFSRNTGQQFVLEWGLPLLERKKISELIDPRLGQNYVKQDVECMMHAASLCILPHPEQRPRISKVLKILEGDFSTDMTSYAQCTSSYPKQYMNNIYGAESPMINTKL